jgi:uncharacterized RmlC-like cupin family protein
MGALGSAGIGSKLEALFITLQAGGSSGARLHANETNLFALVFAGEVQLQLQDVTHLLRRGDTIMIPPATLHRWQNNSAKVAQLLKVVARLLRRSLTALINDIVGEILCAVKQFPQEIPHGVEMRLTKESNIYWAPKVQRC